MVFVNLRHDFSNILFENFYNKLILPTFKTIPNECPPESEFLEGLLPPLKTSASPSSPSSVICHVILVFPNIETLPANKGERLTVLESAENEIAACVAIKYFPSSNCALMKNLVREGL